MKLNIKQLLVCLLLLNSFLYITTSHLEWWWNRRRRGDGGWRPRWQPPRRNNGGFNAAYGASREYNSRTNPNDWGQGSIFFLDRHNVDCGQGRVLQGFHLYRPSGNTIAYEFSCKADPTVTNNVYSSQTGWNATGGNERNSANYLDRHNVACRPGFALQQFKLIRNGNQIAYQYRCAEVRNTNQCSGGSTGETYGNRVFENIYLDRQRINVGGDRMLTSFKLNTRYGGGAVYYRYAFGSCRFGANTGGAPRQNFNPPRPGYNPPRPANNPPRPGYNPPRPGYNPPRPNNFPQRNNGFPQRNNGFPQRQNPNNMNPNNFNPNSQVSNNEERKVKIQEGNKFCKTYCVPNLMSKPKKCWMKGVKDCNSCQFKDQRNMNNNNNRDADELCKKACNSLKNSNICAFYPNTNDKKKIINQNILSKFNVRLFRRYLKRLR